MSTLDSYFDFDFLESKTLFEIETSPLTELICYYRDFDSVLKHVGDMYYDVELIAGVCDISKEEARRQLLEKEIMSVLDHFDYWESEEVQEQYKDLYLAYAECLLSQHYGKRVKLY